MLGGTSISTNAALYEALKVFRDATFEKIRRSFQDSHGSGWVAQIRAMFPTETWDANVRNAVQVRKARLVTDPLLDDFDAQDVRELPKIFDAHYSRLCAISGRRQPLVGALRDIADIRNAISHPAYIKVSKADARRAAERLGAANEIIFSPVERAHSDIKAAIESLYTAYTESRPPIAKSLPPRQNIVRDFVGRKRELDVLFTWLASTSQVWVIEADGGKGKSSLAYVFADAIQTAGHDVQRIIWLTAKQRQFQDGAVQSTTPDFVDLASALSFIVDTYGFSDAVGSVENLEKVALDLLGIEPALVILDDIDSLDKSNEDVAFWFTNTLLRATRSKVLLTSRRALYGLGAYTTTLPGLSLAETRDYLAAVSTKIYGAPQHLTTGDYVKQIHSATEGSPLYLEDIVRLVLVTGQPVQQCVSEWRERTGQVAREYALRREFDILPLLSQQILLATAFKDGDITRAELLAALNCHEEDLTSAINELQKFYLISYPDLRNETPTFSINRNLAFLVKSAMQGDASFRKIANAVKQLRPSAKPHRVAADAMLAIRDAVAAVKLDRHAQAETILRDALVNYPDEASLLSHLGWILMRWPQGHRQNEAIDVLERAVKLRHKHKATYENLARLYIEIDEYEKATRVLNAALEFKPRDSELIYLRALSVAGQTIDLLKNIDLVSTHSYAVIAKPVQDAVSALDNAITFSEGLGDGGRVRQLRDTRVYIKNRSQQLKRGLFD